MSSHGMEFIQFSMIHKCSADQIRKRLPLSGIWTSYLDQKLLAQRHPCINVDKQMPFCNTFQTDRITQVGQWTCHLETMISKMANKTP